LKRKTCIFFSDASYSIKDKIAIISYVGLDLEKRKTKIIKNAKNIFEAEKEAILFALKDNIFKCSSIVVFSDNLYAVLDLKKNIVSKKKFTPFKNLKYMDIVWIPREYNLADFFTKFIENNDGKKLDKIIEEKLKSLNIEKENYKNIYEEMNNLLLNKGE
jgi:hypothetical protein